MLKQPLCAVSAVFFNFAIILLNDSLIWLNKNAGIFRIITNKKTRQETHCYKYRQFATKHGMQYINIRMQHENCNIVQEVECSYYRLVRRIVVGYRKQKCLGKDERNYVN